MFPALATLHWNMRSTLFELVFVTIRQNRKLTGSEQRTLTGRPRSDGAIELGSEIGACSSASGDRQVHARRAVDVEADRESPTAGPRIELGVGLITIPVFVVFAAQNLVPIELAVMKLLAALVPLTVKASYCVSVESFSGWKR